MCEHIVAERNFENGAVEVDLLSKMDPNNITVIDQNLLSERLVLAEERLVKLEAIMNDPVERIKRDLGRRKVFSATMVQAPTDYYDRSLQERAVCLQCSIPQLTKSIIFENTSWIKYDDESNNNDKTNAQYYLVVVQYQAKLDTDLLVDLIHTLRPPASRLPRKRFHFRLAPEHISDTLSGFQHNGVSPFGMHHDIPIVICSHCLEVQPSYLFMGGGKVDMKV